MRVPITINRLLYLLLALMALGYVLARAIHIGVTYDEATTLKNFVPASFMHIINYTPVDANNHILNSLLIKLLFSFGNNSLFIARLPAIFSFIVYLYYSYKIADTFLPRVVGVAAFVLLVVNPFLLDFFGLARGYALAVGMETASLYYLMLFATHRLPRYAWYALGLAALGTLGNFSLLNYYMAIWLPISFITLISMQGRESRKVIIGSLLITACLAGVLYEPIRKIREEHCFFYGGTNGFYIDTLLSLAGSTLYTNTQSTLAAVLLNACLVLFSVISVISFYVSGFSLASIRDMLFMVLAVSVLSTILQHHLLGTVYLYGRTALFFYPLIILAFFFALAQLRSSEAPRIASFILVAAWGANFLLHANISTTLTWPFDAPTKQVLEMINTAGARANTRQKIDYSWVLKGSVNYYQDRYQYPFIEIVKSKESRERVNTAFDYYLWSAQSLPMDGYDAATQQVHNLKKDTIAVFKDAQVYLFRNKKQDSLIKK